MYVKLDANWFTSLSINGWCSHLKLNQLLRVSMMAVLISCSVVFELIESEIESPEIELMFAERNYIVDFCNIDRLVSSVTVFCQGCVFRNRMLDDNHEDEERNESTKASCELFLAVFSQIDVATEEIKLLESIT